MPLIGGRPGSMQAYGDATQEMSADLEASGGSLADAVGAFRDRGRWQEFMGQVPPVELDVAQARADVATLGRWVRAFGGALRAVDGSGEVVTLDQGSASLSALVLAALSLGPGVDGSRLVRDGDDLVLIGSDEADFVEVVEVDGETVLRVRQMQGDGTLGAPVDHALSPDEVGSLTIRTGDGNDVVSIAPGLVDQVEIAIDVGEGDNMVGYTNPDSPAVVLSGGDGLTVFAGDGDNIIHGSAGADRISVGAGDNDVNGNAGDDRISTGDGDNRVGGGDGNDSLLTGTGVDVIDGGRGDDAVQSLGGASMLSGGEGDDTLIGGDGDDTFVGGRGADHVRTGGGDDRYLYDGAGSGDTYHAQGGGIRLVRVVVDGRPGDRIEVVRPDGMTDAEWDAWSARVEGDLELLRHTPSGQHSLEAVDDASDDGFLWWGEEHLEVSPQSEGDAGQPFDVEGYMRSGHLAQNSVAYSDLRIGYDADARLGPGNPPSAIVLLHELAHGYDNLNGRWDENDGYREIVVDAEGEPTGTENVWRSVAEINSVGFDNDGDGEYDPLHPQDDEHPEELNENSVREDLGVPTRPGYVTDEFDVPDGGRVVYEVNE